MNADRHLLFGLLALQNEFIDKRQLVAAFGAWIADHSNPLDEILVQQNALSAADQSVLSRLVERHVAARGGDVAASLQSLSGAGSVRDELEQLANHDIQASMAKLQPLEFLTVPPSVGQSTSAGRRFIIRRPLDRGGLGIVSVALDNELNREVALKEIRGDRADEQSYRSKFLLEAEVTGGLEHPGIVPVYGLGTGPDGRPYYAMRLIKGDNLLVHIKRFHEQVTAGKESFDGPALRKLLRRFLDVCEAIDYAHARGVLHRDLKPDNVMLGKYGETLVVDWGLAKPLGAKSRGSLLPNAESEPSLVPSGSHEGMTVLGSIIGTPNYAPPEQLSGDIQSVNERSDVYGLGAMLYELLTGIPPVQGESLEAVIKSVIAGDIKLPRSIQTDVPKALEAICMQAIATRPEARYATAAELGHEIERWLDDLPVNSYAEPLWLRARRWMRAHPAISATTSAIVLMSALGLGLFSSIVSRNNTQLAVLNRQLDDRNLTLDQTNVELVTANERETAARIQAEEEKARAEASQKVANMTKSEAVRASNLAEHNFLEAKTWGMEVIRQEKVAQYLLNEAEKSCKRSEQKLAKVVRCIAAVQDWDDLSTVPADKMPNLLWLQGYLRFTKANWNGALQAVSKLRSLKNKSAEDLYDAVYIYSWCAVAPDQQSTREQCLRDAVATLKEAIAAGYSDFDHIAKDTDLDPLRELPEFKALLPVNAE